MAPSHEIFVTIENILKSPFTLTAIGISISSLILFFVFARKTKSASKSSKVRSNNNRQAANRQQQKSTTTKKSSEAKKGGSPKQASVAKPTSDKIKKEQQSKQANKKNKEAETKKKEAENKKGTSQLEKKIKVAEANPRQQLNDRSQNKDDGGWIKLVSRREKRERSAKLKELKAGEQTETKSDEVSKAGEKKPYRGPRDGVKRSTPFQKRT